MIAFGCAITDHQLYHRCAEPGIKLVAEPDSKIIPMGSSGLGTASIFRNYNLLIEEALKLDDLEMLVLIHQDAEIVDRDFCAKVRDGLSDPEVGVLGCAGAIGVRNIAWWDGSVTLASFSHRYTEYGGGEILGSTYDLEDAPPEAHAGEVDTIDGFMMALPPWTIENIRFDESLGQFHGYDFDLCQQIRAAGKKVMAEHIMVIHHHSLDLIPDHGRLDRGPHARRGEVGRQALALPDGSRGLEGARALGGGPPGCGPHEGKRGGAGEARRDGQLRARASVHRAERELAAHEAPALAEVPARPRRQPRR